ncbi:MULTISPECIES: inner membrane-spanning protein YciB [Pacificibacter]|uniref:inner membrane-spanning protein YciB n=1 Tax=Pacificibacter TaxID=1042323 RepID=UPI001C098D88|nr:MULTISPECIES: inner membrane-spanning protein YciB [Pacificibacter]MBU2935797.1 septation protein IspZ [Pacificibacter marinus]MDO6614293.1 inner membrane-spanning protein YciB [Pacificibacter sp. 1_MG-2023]
MTEKNVKPWVKTALEMGPVLAFFVGFIVLKDREFVVAGETYTGFIAMTALFVPLLMLSTFVLWRLTGKLSAMQIMTLVLVTVFGGLTIFLNDERFFKMKPTMIYALFAGILGFGLLRGQSYLRVVMGEMMPMDHTGWMKLTLRITLLFLALAVANELIWRNLSTETWVQFKTFGLPIVMFGFFMTQSGLLSRHTIEADGIDPDDKDAS